MGSKQLNMMKEAKTGCSEWMMFLLLAWSVGLGLVSAHKPGFISMDCGLRVRDISSNDPDAYEVTDEQTGIQWLPDGLIQAQSFDAMTLGNISDVTLKDKTMDNAMAMSTFRYFPILSESARKKYCYEVTVNAQENYLIRLGFYLGSSNTILTPPIEFDVAINTNVVFKVEFSGTNSAEEDQPILQEFIWRTDTSKLIHVCLIQKTGTPFISSLEFRLLEKQTYNDMVADDYMQKVIRYNGGALPTSTNIRYVADVYDRIWSSAPPEGIQLYTRIAAVKKLTEGNDLLHNRPPVQVMEDACTDSEAIQISTATPYSRFYACLYFQEVNDTLSEGARIISLKDSASPELARGLDIAVQRSNFTQLCYHGSDTMNLSLTRASASEAFPILNGVEVYGIFSVDKSAINADDGAVIDAVKNALPLADWKSDPCYPVPYDWIVCNENSKVVTINLSGKSFSSYGTKIPSIPFDIGSLDQLEELYLDHDNLEGHIPQSFSQLQKLRVLQLSNNKLGGELPLFLESLSSLRELNLDNNMFSGAVRKSLLNSGIHVSFSGNPNLCIEGQLNCTVSNPSSTSSSGRPWWIIGVAGGVGALMIFLVILLLCFFYPGCCLYRGRRRNAPLSDERAIQPIATGRRASIVDDEAYAQKLEQDFWNAGIQLSSLQIPPPSKQSSMHKEQPQLSKQSSLNVTPSMSASQSSASRRPSADMRGSPLGAIADSPHSSKGDALVISPRSSRTKRDAGSAAAGKSSRSSEDGKAQAVVFSLKQILHITRNYESQIGEGPTGPVYHGFLEDKTDVAVKVQDDRSLHSTEFVKKVKALAKTQHRNLVPLIGYCTQDGKRMVVYEFLMNGTLQDKLRGERRGGTRPLDWATRVSIIFNAAQGLEHLHTGCDPPKAHGNVKSSNILLDEHLLAKLGDYGISSSVISTPGYIDPSADYSDTSKRLKLEQDVYSFGIVMLETITGLAPTTVTKLPDRSERSIVSSFRIAMKTGNLEDIVDFKLGPAESLNMESVWSFAGICFSCLEPRVENRPQMTRVTTQLRKALDLLG